MLNKKNKAVMPAVLMMFIAITLTALPIYGAEIGRDNVKADGKKATVTATYISKNKNKTYKFKDEITVDGKKYKLKDESYTSKELVEKKSIQTEDKEEFEKTYTKTIDGVEYTFTADIDNIEWKTEKITETLNEYREYYEKSMVPSKLELNGLVYPLQKIKDGERVENCTWQASFYSYLKVNKRAIFNGKDVEYSAAAPTWDGYEDDVIEYLGYSKDKTTVSGGRWTSDWEEYGDGYIRYAEYYGTRTLPLYTAKFTYVGKEGGKTMNTADVTYKSDGYYTITATAEYKARLTTAQKVLIGGGLVVILCGIAAAIMVIAKRKKEED